MISIDQEPLATPQFITIDDFDRDSAATPRFITIDDEPKELSDPPASQPRPDVEEESEEPRLSPQEDPFTIRLGGMQVRLLSAANACFDEMGVVRTTWLDQLQSYDIEPANEDEADDYRGAVLRANQQQRAATRDALAKLQTALNDTQLLLNDMSRHSNRLFWQDFH